MGIGDLRSPKIPSEKFSIGTLGNFIPRDRGFLQYDIDIRKYIIYIYCIYVIYIVTEIFLTLAFVTVISEKKIILYFSHFFDFLRVSKADFFLSERRSKRYVPYSINYLLKKRNKIMFNYIIILIRTNEIRKVFM